MFEEFGDVFEKQIATDGANTRNFIPVRGSRTGELAIGENALTGPRIFHLPPESVPTPEQISEIWFTFNLVANYVNNKNFRPGGEPRKLIAWVQMAQVPYPTNPYMSLFTGLAHRLVGENELAEQFHRQAMACCQTEYWMERFDDFGITPLIEQFPQTKDETYQAVHDLRARMEEHYRPYLDRREDG
jgi:hypothetical protein